MNTKIVMISSGLFLGVLGITFTFIPDEIVSGLVETPSPMSILPLQLLGALYIGFALLNWMAKESLIGGIYNRPIAIGNFTYFAVGAMALIKIITKIQTHSEIVISLATVYVIFAILFGYVIRTSPFKTEKKN